MAEADPELDAHSVAEALMEALLPVTLAPQNLFLIARAKTDAAARQEIVQCLLAAADDPEATLGIERRYFWNEVVDLASTGKPIYRDWHSRGVSRLLSVRHAVSEHVTANRLRVLVQSAIDEPSAKCARDGALVRLDLIDVALYHALVQHPELIKTLDWRLFERLLADVLETFGYEIELQRGTKDGGVDLFAVRHDRLGPHRYLLRAKRWSHRVSVEPVRQLLFLHAHHQATKACLATTSGFTRGAWELAAQYRWHLDLRDLNGIQEWVREAARLKTGET
jgi:hypothetical protein